MGAYHGPVEKLDQVRRSPLLGEQLEGHLEYTRAAQPPEALPYAVPLAELDRQSALGDIVHYEIVECFQDLRSLCPGSHWLDCAASNTSSTSAQSCSVICVSVAEPLGCRARSDSTNADSGIPQFLIAGTPSTRPKIRSRLPTIQEAVLQ